MSSSAHTKAALLERYGTYRNSPYAAEILAWLRGEYAFDPLCLTS